MNHQLTAVTFLFLCLSLTAFAGCGGGDNFNRIDVTGEVTFNELPLPSGQVIFTTTDGKSSARSLAIVKDGKFATAPGAGPSKGNYHISVVIPGDTTGEGDDADETILGTYTERATISEAETHFTFSFMPDQLTATEN